MRKLEWEKNAKMVEQMFGSYVDWGDRFYLCPECGEPIYEIDWSNEDLKEKICLICDFNIEED